MPNGNERAALLLHPSLCLPTHLVVVNLDARLHDPLEETAAFFPSFGVSLLHFHDGPSATVPVESINEAQLLRMLPDLASFDPDDPSPWARATYRYHRPSILHAIRSACKAWTDETRQERTVFVFIGAPRSHVEAALLGELPLDTEALFFRRTGLLPLVLRLLVAPREPRGDENDAPVAQALADLEQAYFELPDFPRPFRRRDFIGSASASAFDTTVWIDENEVGDVIPSLRRVLRLQSEENARYADNRPPSKRSENALATFEEALAVDGAERSIDWLSLCVEHHAPRLWMDGLTALAALLDLERFPRRSEPPLARLQSLHRESNWEANAPAQAYLRLVERPRAYHDDLTRSDFPYRVTDEDRPSKLELAHHLADLGEFERAAEISSELLAEDPHHRLLNRMLGTDLYVSGHRERGREILTHCITLTELDPTLAEAERADEIATLHHLLSDFDAAISGYERAIDADPLNAHAYQGLVLVLRSRGEDALADHWLQAARRRDLDLPLLTDADDAHLDDAFAPQAEAVPAGRSDSRDTGRLRERRSRWWRFLRR